MDSLEQYWRLRKLSTDAHKQAGIEASTRNDYGTYVWYVNESWLLADQAQAIMVTLPESEQKDIRDKAWESMAEGFVRALFG